MNNELCLLCGKSTGDFVGLCDLCCKVIKIKSEAFARQSRLRLEEAQAAEQREKVSHIVRNYNRRIRTPL